ncbi:cell volume regulation protein A [Friedmanniella endophytica]|uniref:Cell volume regulation protein A n=1 Tax=Microlunatus kandeliicorticis TaxID=1759536 RepID=A0A7W3IRI5_9ACTN|nr:potassium/proton antiporter [Microlunatus kandeliicorticis]MBA8793912.1 cell volume regulation protein A [Microlunatus kandeliicorticis]
MIDLDALLLEGAVVVIAAILAARVGSRFGLPALLLFLGLGMAMGDAGLGIRFDDASLARALGFGALVLILAEGGLTTRWADIRNSIGIAGLLATVGTLISVALMALFGHFVLGLDVWIAILLGAVTSPTDAAAVFAVLRRVPLPHKIRGALEAESGLNDAPTVLLVVAASTAALAGSGGEEHTSLGVVLALIPAEIVGGVAIGLVLGWLGVQLLRRVALPSSGLYPLAALVWAVFAYGVAAEIHTSGFAAVYLAGLVLGNANLPHRAATRSFVEGIGWVAQIGLFVMLGLLASPGRITWSTVGIALAAGLFLTFVARPLSVFASAVWFRVPLADQAFLSWAGLRGAVPIVLATIPLAEGVPGATLLFDVVLVFVIVFTLLQGPTLPWLADRLGLTRRLEPSDVEVEVAPLDKISADLLQVTVPFGSRLSGIEVGELRLPRHSVISLIIRDSAPMVPVDRERLKIGDELLIVTPSAQREQTERRLRALGRHGRLARWHAAEPDETPRRVRNPFVRRERERD